MADEVWLDRVDFVVLAAPLDEQVNDNDGWATNAHNLEWLQRRLSTNALVEVRRWPLTDLDARLVLYRRER